MRKRFAKLKLEKNQAASVIQKRKCKEVRKLILFIRVVSIVASVCKAPSFILLKCC